MQINGINSMISDSGGTTTDLRTVFTSNVDDFDKDTVDAYRNNFRTHSIDHPWNDLDDTEFLKLVNAAVDVDGETRPSLAGLLMFGKEHNIVREFPDYQLEFRIPERGNMGWKDRIVSWDGTWPGNVFGFYSRVMPVLMSMNPKPREIGNDMVRVANTDLDRCMREMLVNALVNADYSQPCGVVVVRDTESLSVKNPGWFRIPVSKALEGGSSDQRNKAVGKMLSLIGVSERAGSGIVNMLHYCRRLGFKPPEFLEESEPNMVSVTLELDPIAPKNGLEYELSERILEKISENPKTTYRSMSSELGVSTSRIQKVLKELQSENRIVRIGGTRGHWQIVH